MALSLSSVSSDRGLVNALKKIWDRLEIERMQQICNTFPSV